MIAQIHKVTKFFLISAQCHIMDTAEVIHGEVEWELAGKAQSNQCLVALRYLVIVTVL